LPEEFQSQQISGYDPPNVRRCTWATSCDNPNRYPGLNCCNGRQDLVRQNAPLHPSDDWSQHLSSGEDLDGSWVEQRPIGGYWTEEDAANDGPPPGTVLTEEQKEILKQNPNVKPRRCPWSQSCANPNREAWAREACCYGRTVGFGKEVNRQDIPIPKVVPRRCTWENSCNNRKRDPWASCCYGKAHSLKSQKSRLLRRLAARD